MAISDDLPASRREWPPEVLDAAEKFTCGDVVEDPPYFYLAVPRYAVMVRTRDYIDDSCSGAEIIDATSEAEDADAEFPFGVITTQTCDIGEVDFDTPTRPFVSISPVFEGSDIDGNTRSLLKEGKCIGGLLHLPALSNHRPGFWVADFRIEMPVEKSWLVGRSPIKGFASEASARRVPEAIDAIRSRPAWADVINECVYEALVSSLKELKSTANPLYLKVSREIEEVGAAANSMLEPKDVQLAAFSQRAPVDPDVREWWDTTSAAIGTALEAHGIVVQPPELLALDHCSVLTHRRFAPVNLSRFSKP